MQCIFRKYEEGCPSNLNTGGGGIEEVRSTMNEAQTEIETTEAILTALVDGGDTESLNAEVENSSPSEAVEVYNELMSESPNLSETVLESTIEQETVIPNAMVRDIMVANPHSAKSLTLLDKLDERYDPLPDYMKAQILAGRSIQNLKQELESQLAGHKLRKARAMNVIIRYYCEEFEEQATSDSLLALYLSDNTPESAYRLAWLYLKRGEYALGENTLGNIPNQFEINEAGLQQHSDIAMVYNLLSEVYANGSAIDSLSTAQLATLQTMATEATIPAKTYARNILLTLDELEYDEPVLMPDIFKSATAMDEYNALPETEVSGRLSVFPNPASGFVILRYDLQSETEGIISIRNASGSDLQQFNINEKQNQLTLVTKDWKPGVYMATLKLNSKTIESIKFTVVN